MFENHNVIFVTFSPADSAIAARYVALLVAAFPERRFCGRHEGNVSISQAIAASTLTVVLETSRTAMSPQVQQDVQDSLSKTPPNAVICIRLEEAPAEGESGPGELFQGAGVETVAPGMEAVGEAIVRSEASYKIQPRITQAASSSESGGNCNR